MLIATRSSASHMKTGEVTYHVWVESVPRRDHVIATVYHWYDMRIPGRIPGWRRFEKWLARHGAIHAHFVGVDCDEGHRVRWRDRLYGWTVEQDLRCYELSHGKREFLGKIDLTEDEYVAAGGKPRPFRRPPLTAS